MSAQLLKQFISSLQQDVQRLDQLNQLLEHQYELMSQRDGEQLQQLKKLSVHTFLMNKYALVHQLHHRALKNLQSHQNDPSLRRVRSGGRRLLGRRGSPIIVSIIPFLTSI